MPPAPLPRKPAPPTPPGPHPGPPPPPELGSAPADRPRERGNPEADLARAFVLETDRHVFLTGRAGTGKTTFLRRLRDGDLARRRHVVVAPTGVAAINAGGATIHSTFGLPFGTLTPERLRPGRGRRGLSKRKAQVLRALDLLVVDEVSMVRADVLDAIDHVLRRVRRSRRPFGGVQLLLIGDLHQLPPVVTRDEEAEMAARYDSPYFFSAAALRGADLVTVELRRVYRQADDAFVALLGEVRAGKLTADVLAALNARFVAPTDPAFPGPEAGYITLASHRHTARDINRRRLGELPGASATYEARVTGDFPPSAYPTDATLELRVGAQVMFVKNDPDGAFYNGKLGTVTALADGRVTVDCGDDAGALEVGRLAWENTSYALEAGSKQVAAEVAGRFSQVPLRLAWAITIHKSQGLTFDRVVIDAAAAFAHGQVYVALSRCRTLGGIVLRTPLAADCVPTDGDVADYTLAARRDPPDASALAQARVAYRRGLLPRAFDLEPLARAARDLLRFYLRNESAFARRVGSAFEDAVRLAEGEVFAVARGFRQPLADLLAAWDFEAEAIEVPARCRRGATYLSEKLRDGLAAFAAGLDLATDNQQVDRRIGDLADALAREVRVALAALSVVDAERFSAAAFERARTDAGLEPAPQSGRRPAGKRAAAGAADLAHPELLELLVAWRLARSREQDVPAYRIASTRTLREVAASLPTDRRGLLRVHGIGEARAAAHGVEILALVAEFCAQREIDSAGAGAAPSLLPPAPAAPPATGPSPGPSISATVALSLSMFRGGSTPAEIAAERELVESTVRGHLALAVEAGELTYEEAVEEGLRARIAAHFEAHGGDVAAAQRALGNTVDRATLRLERRRLAR